MSNERENSTVVELQKGIFSRLMLGMIKRRSILNRSNDDPSPFSAVEEQTENSRRGGTIWQAVNKGDEESFLRLVAENPANVDARGPVGECPVHMLFLYGTESHLKIAQFLIKNFPHTITQIYNLPEYYGEVALHIAIIKRNANMVEWLLGDEANQAYRHQQLTAAASGTFFRFGRPCYYGETPLAFACCTNQWNIVEILLRHGASMDSIDTNGNNILHLMVIHNLPKIYTKFKKRWIQENERQSEDGENDYYGATPLWKRVNRDGYTPLTLAAKLGQAEMFSFLLEERKIIQWSYGPVSCVLYPLDQVDLDLEVQSDQSSMSAIEAIVKNGHVELIMHPRIIDLVNKKWERFARRIFFNRFLVSLAYMLIFLLTTILDQSRIETVEGEDETVTNVEAPGSVHQMVCALGRLIVLMGALKKGRNEINEMFNVGVRKYFQTTGSGLLENSLSCLFCLTIVLVNILRVLNCEAETAMLAFASIFGWGYMLFFVMAFRLTGPFVVMIYQMLINDVLRFCIIYVVFLIGFSQTFFVLFNYNGFSGFLISVKQSFLGMLGDFDLDAYIDTEFRYINVTFLIFYIIVVTILLLNLLVAMMGDTYGNIIEDATQVWHLERARIVFAIESEMSYEERNLFKNKYWTNIDRERYLQVEEVNEKDFLDESSDHEDKDDEKSDRAERSEADF